MERLAVVLGVMLVLALSGCGDDDPEPVSSVTSEEARALVVSRHAITPAEYDRIDDDGEGVLGCEGEGGATWDYDGGPDDERGRKPDDALRDALDDLNSDRGGEGGGADLPTQGWVALEDLADGEVWFLLADGSNWRALVLVLGDPEAGSWRHHQAILCP